MVVSPNCSEMLVAEVLLLGDPVLRQIARPVAPDDVLFAQETLRLQAVLEAFRSVHGFGRAISAPQIGIEKRFIALNLGNGPFVLVNPVIVELDSSIMTLWDDCMSLPGLMVKLPRSTGLALEYDDENGSRREWRVSEAAVAELLQHEIDHLDGVLAIDHAIDKYSIVLREAYLAEKDYFDRQVDYVIQPTV